MYSKNRELHDIIENILSKIKLYADFREVYDNLLKEQMKYFSNKELQNLQNIFVSSTRFERTNNKLVVKINRFGHAMDPDRGILFFVSRLFGLENIITKFIIQRETMEGKESYKTLFDGLSYNIQAKIKTLITKPFNENIALDIFKIATGIHFKLKRVDFRSYEILDCDLIDFLKTYKSITYKSIFINSCELQLCDYNHNILCRIVWNDRIVKNYLQSLNTLINIPLALSKISFNNAKEDIITYTSKLLLEKIGCRILAISYPDAQGDRAILIGQGRSTKRIYLDIIAVKEHKKFNAFVLLQENKEKYIDLKGDETKIVNLKKNHLDSLKILLKN